MWGNVFCTSQHFAPPRVLPSRRETKHYPPLPPFCMRRLLGQGRQLDSLRRSFWLRFSHGSPSEVFPSFLVLFLAAPRMPPLVTGGSLGPCRSQYENKS